LTALLAGAVLVCAPEIQPAGNQVAASEAAPSFSVLNNECALGQWGDLLVEAIVPAQPELLSQDVRRELFALLEESRRKIWDLLNEVQTEQWKLAEMARTRDAAGISLRKQFLRIQLLCGFTVDAAIATRERAHSVVEQAETSLRGGAVTRRNSLACKDI
jgi:hypothetical protein